MFRDLDTVALIVDLPHEGLYRGNVGTIVQTYTPESFEVESVDGDGHTYGLATLKADQLLRLQFAAAA